MDKSDPKNIIKKHYRKLIKLITIVNKHFKTESIHELRVEYKKLRAFLRMISEEKDAEQKIKIPGKLKKAYHIAGSIRDLQLQCKSILAITEEETKKPKSYLKLIEQQIKKLKPEFSDIPLKKTIKKSIKKTGELTVEKINIIQSGKFINNNCTAIMAIITSRNFDDVNMHAIRKHLKDIFYTMQELEDINNETEFNTRAIAKEEIEYFDQLLEEIGNFQDKCTSIALLDDNWLYSLNSANRQILKGIKETFIADKYTIKNDLINKLQHEIIPHLQVFQNIDMHLAN